MILKKGYADFIEYGGRRAPEFVEYIGGRYFLEPPTKKEPLTMQTFYFVINSSAVRILPGSCGLPEYDVHKLGYYSREAANKLAEALVSKFPAETFTVCKSLARAKAATPPVEWKDTE